MRLRLSIQRNGLPPVKTWFATDATADPPPTISKLLEQVNELVPLEAESWGLEDYVVTISDYECLHYSKVKDVVKENDRVCIRPLSTPEYRTRTLSGRYQINAGGQHLTDGVPFGRPLIRQPNRPAIQIPPRKRRRLALDADVTRDDEDIEHDITLLGNGVEAEVDEEELDSEEDDDFVPGDSADEVVDSEDEAGDDTNGISLSPQLGLRRTSAGQKRRRSVSFSKVVDVEKDSHSILNGSSSSEVDDSSVESEEDSDSESDTTSSDDDSSGTGDDLAPSRARIVAGGSSDSDSSSEATSEENEGSASSAEKQLQADAKRRLRNLALAGKPQAALPSKPPVPPGEGKKETQRRNLRRRQNRRLYNMIKIGKLPPNATVSDLEAFPTTRTTVQPSNAIRDQSPKVNDLEFQRQRLLQQLEEGGIEVTADSASRSNSRSVKAEGQHTDPSSSTIRSTTDRSSDLTETSEKKFPSTDGGGLGDDPADDVECRRPRLNLASSNRLIFGSLGVRTPKTKDDSEKVREKLAARSQTQSGGPDVPQVLITSNSQDAVMTEDQAVDALSDAWKNRIKLKAVECVDEAIVLSQPPYPFVQCWDEQYVWNRPQDKKKHKKKRKSQAWEYYGDEETQDAQWTEITHEDDVMTGSESTRHMRFADEGVEEAHVDNNSFPSMPADAAVLPALAAQYCNPGIYVLLKELHVDASTKWRPEISDWQLARVDENLEGDGIRVTLAPQHRVTERPQYDDSGKRIRAGFEMPDSDDDFEHSDDSRVDDGVREIALESLMEIRLVKAANDAPEIESNAVEIRQQSLPLSGINGSEVPHTNGDADNDSDIVWEGIGDEAEDAF